VRGCLIAIRACLLPWIPNLLMLNCIKSHRLTKWPSTLCLAITLYQLYRAPLNMALNRYIAPRMMCWSSLVLSAPTSYCINITVAAHLTIAHPPWGPLMNDDHPNHRLWWRSAVIEWKLHDTISIQARVISEMANTVDKADRNIKVQINTMAKGSESWVAMNCCQ